MLAPSASTAVTTNRRVSSALTSTDRNGSAKVTVAAAGVTCSAKPADVIPSTVDLTTWAPGVARLQVWAVWSHVPSGEISSVDEPVLSSRTLPYRSVL